VTSTEDLVLRRAEPSESDVLADLHTGAREAAVPAMPATVHTPEETRAWMRGRVGAGHEVWVAERSGAVVGYAALSATWLEDLYVAPGLTGQGIGSALLELAKSLRPGGFALWVFASNSGARRFYLRHGLLELEKTDGSGNEEGAPDVRMAWPGSDPVGYLRGEVDAVDEELALLLARRTALTAAVQRFKPVPGHAGRDPDREAEIVSRMARRAPGVPEDAWRRIVHEVITVSLDLAEPPLVRGRTGPRDVSLPGRSRAPRGGA
jgi:chorismate mutase/GNAT superfamily N-acetyltransferase